MPSTILDAFGRPAEFAYSGGFANGNSAYVGTQDREIRIPRPDIAQDMARLLPRYKHRMMVADARWIATTMPLVRGMVVQKSNYVSGSGWRPQYVGRNETWGKRAEELLTEANKICDVRGPRYPFSKIWEIGCRLWDTDGDWFFLLTESRDGFPQFQTIEGHRIGSRDYGNTVKGGRYDGAIMINGIVYNRAGFEIAYHVLGEIADDDEFISSRDMVHVANPSWFSEGRPFPTLAYSVLDWYDVKETRDSEKAAQLINSRLTLIEANETGKQNVGQVLVNPLTPVVPSAAGNPIDVIEKGLIRYVKTGKGSIEAHESSRPSDGWQKFDRTVVAGAAFGMDWRIEMMDLSLLGGAGVRGFQDNINTSIMARFNDLKPYAIRATGYQISKFIQRGDLPADDDFLKWDFTQPPEFTVDPARNADQVIRSLRAGIDSEDDVIRRIHGTTPEAFYRTRARTIKLRRQIAKDEGLTDADLANLTMPGDPIPMGVEAGEQKLDADGNPVEDGEGSELNEQQIARARIDAMGVAVRAGSLTPSPELESQVRAILGLDVMPASVKAAWAADKNIRLPITVKAGDAAQADPAFSSEPQEDEPTP